MAEAALQGTAAQTAGAGAGGATVTLAAGVVGWARRHRAAHRAGPVAEVEPLESPGETPRELPTIQPAVVAAMSAPPLPSVPSSAWAPPSVAPSLFLVPQPSSSADPDWEPDPMEDTVPHPVVKLFPLGGLEPDLAAGSIDERVYAAFDAERQLVEAARLAGGRHASEAPTDTAVPRNASYRSRHSA